MNRRLVVCLASSVMGVLAVAALVASSASVAQAAKGQKVEVLDQLRSAHKLLASADHDYDGRRAKAMEEIHKAIHEIEGKHKKIVTTTTPVTTTPAVVATTPKVKKAKVMESQAASDAKLHEAMDILAGVQGEISAHHPKAKSHVDAAMGHLKVALNIR